MLRWTGAEGRGILGACRLVGVLEMEEIEWGRTISSPLKSLPCMSLVYSMHWISYMRRLGLVMYRHTEKGSKFSYMKLKTTHNTIYRSLIQFTHK